MVNKMVDEKNETLPPEQDLPEKLSSILEDGVTVYEDETSATQRDEDYVYVYRGEALNEEELYQLSAREDVRQVLIAGPQHSGKTTLVVMLYYLFQEGRNSSLRFGGSLTMEGFKNRASKILLASGESEPLVDRTSRSTQNRYLHFVLADAAGKKSNLILTDISGELFTSEYMKEIGELYSGYENVILTVDGEKLRDPMERQHEIIQIIQLLKNLLKFQVVDKQSKLQIICTKRDLIEETEDQGKDTIKFWKKKQDSIRGQYEADVSSLDFHLISALRLDEDNTAKELEQIMLECLEGGKDEFVVPHEESALRRYFDKFKMRG